MCSHYRAPDHLLFKRMHGMEGFQLPVGVREDVWPGYVAPIIRRSPEWAEHDIGPYEPLPAVFGLLPFWCKDEKFSKRTYNARSETVAEKPSFRDAWRRAQHCIIPAESIFEPDWRSGKAVPTRIRREDGEPLGIAGLWERWKNPIGVVVHSFTMLTVNADDHALMCNYHKPNDEKRMVVILPRGLYDDWLDAPAERSMDFMRQFPANRLMGAGMGHK